MSGLHMQYQSLTHPEQLTSSPAHQSLNVPYTDVTMFSLLYHVFTVSFRHFDMFRYTNAYHCVIIAYSIQFSNMLYRFVSEEQGYHVALECVVGCTT